MKKTRPYKKSSFKKVLRNPVFFFFRKMIKIFLKIYAYWPEYGPGNSKIQPYWPGWNCLGKNIQTINWRQAWKNLKKSMIEISGIEDFWRSSRTGVFSRDGPLEVCLTFWSSSSEYKTLSFINFNLLLTLWRSCGSFPFWKFSLAEIFSFLSPYSSIQLFNQPHCCPTYLISFPFLVVVVYIK